MSVSVNLSDPYRKFETAYDQRDYEAHDWIEKGGRVIGCLGSDVPEELIIAAGFLPIRVLGDPQAELDLSSVYLEKGFDPFIRAQFARLVGGSYRYLDRLVISNSSDPVIRSYYYLRALSKVEKDLRLPDLYFFDFLHTRFRMSALYNRDRVYELKEQLEDWSGKSISDKSLQKAIEICNENRSLLQELAELRSNQDVKLTGTQALKVIGSSVLMPKEKHNELLRSLLQELKRSRPLTGVKLFITGSTHDHAEFYELVESCGAIIVGEDHDLGLRQYIGEVNPNVDPIDALVDQYHLRYLSSSQSTVSERIESLVKHVQLSGAQGVIFFIHQADDAPSWDYPQQKNMLESLGIPSLLIDRQPYVLSDKEKLVKQISTFIYSIET